MRAALLRAPAAAAASPLDIVALAEPDPGAGEVVIDVEACGVCRTDLQLCEGDLVAHALPVVPGHQVVGTVSALGAGVGGEAVVVGDRVGVAWIASTCGRCRFCSSGRENLCDEARFTGWDRHGGFAERMRFSAMATFMLLWGTFVYCPLCHWVWDGGILAFGNPNYGA